MAIDLVCSLAGLFCVWLALRDVFQVVVLPRAPAGSLRISAIVTRSLWRTWPAIGYRLYRNDERREDFLALFAPFSMILLLAVWVGVLVLGYGLLFYAARHSIGPETIHFGGALYYAGTSILTIGYGDITARTGMTRFISLAAGTSGLATVALTTSFLFAVFASFQRREVFVVGIGSRAGAPPSGVGLLVLSAKAEVRDDLQRLFVQAQTFAAEVMESHLAYPILNFFRSSHDYESWVATLGTMLDAAVLLMTAVEDQPAGQARIFYLVGNHAVHDLSHYFGIEENQTPGISREEFDHACSRLAQAGYSIRERGAAWSEFSLHRITYASSLNGLARFFEIPPTEWVGDRSFIRAPHMRVQLPKI
ncbi:MAG: potassium channel family protein [Candidatus Eremiobacteraeota bacterium]|nr:potassium channel family protein [Candidatus Eremiobacteraeota bacterium]